jgi:hypothetical protein
MNQFRMNKVKKKQYIKKKRIHEATVMTQTAPFERTSRCIPLLLLLLLLRPASAFPSLEQLSEKSKTHKKKREKCRRKRQ